MTSPEHNEYNMDSLIEGDLMSEVESRLGKVTDLSSNGLANNTRTGMPQRKVTIDEQQNKESIMDSVRAFI